MAGASSSVVVEGSPGRLRLRLTCTCPAPAHLKHTTVLVVVMVVMVVVVGVGMVAMEDGVGWEAMIRIAFRERREVVVVASAGVWWGKRVWPV